MVNEGLWGRRSGCKRAVEHSCLARRCRAWRHCLRCPTGNLRRWCNALIRRKKLPLSSGPETLEARRALCATLPIYLNADDSSSLDVQHEELQAYSLLADVQSSSGVSTADSAGHPSVQSFVINTSDERGSSTDSDIHNVVSGYEADVQSVLYTEQATYVLASGVPSYPVGPWPDGNPAVATDRSWIFSITHNPQEQTGTKTTVDLGNIGVYVNGVPIYDAQDGMSWNNEGQWHQNAVYFEADGFDNALGHPSPIMGGGGGGGLPPPPGGGGGGPPPPPDGGGDGGFVDGAYHHHQNPVSLRDQLGDDGSGHSPILGWAFDGFPIYGPYGFANSDGSGGVVRLDSSYQLKSGVRPSGPGGSYDGAYIEDFSFVSGSGALDEHNGRFAVTPEYPSGTYYYVATVDASGQAAYPYAIGPTYYGVVDAANKSQSVTVPSTAVAYDPTAPVNEAPTAVRLTNAVTSLPESTDTTNGALVADIVIENDELGSNALSLSAADAGLFEIRNLQLYLKASVDLVARAGTTLLVTVAVADSALPDQAAVMTSLELSIIAETPRLTVTAGGEVHVNSLPLTAAGVAVREVFRLWAILDADVEGDQAFVRAQHTSGKIHRLFADVSAEAWTLRGGLHGVGNSGSLPLDRSARGDAFSLTTGLGFVSSATLPPLVSLGGGLQADDLGRLYTKHGMPLLEQDGETALQVSSLDTFHPIAIGRISAELAWKYSLLWQQDASHEFIEWQFSSDWVHSGVSRKSNESLVDLEAAYGIDLNNDGQIG